MRAIMTDAASRLRQLRIRKGYATAVDAARAYGWSEDTYKSHENGMRGIRPNVAEKYAQALGSTAAYILTGQQGGHLPAVNPVVSLKVVGRVSAGTFRYDEAVEGEGFSVPAVPRKDIATALQYGLLVEGPSVNKRVPDGAYAICALFDSQNPEAQHGQLVHVVRERAGLHEHTIKEIRYTRDGIVLMPVSDDPRHQEPIKLDGNSDDVVRIHGVVIGSYMPL